MSRSSKVTVSWNGASFCSWLLWPLVLMTGDSLRKFRFAERQQRLLPQLPGEKPEPDAAQRQKRCQIPPGGDGAGSKFGARPPVNIQAAHGNQPDSDLWQNGLIAL